MSYYLGIDLGTTYTAAAVWRDGRVEIANLGNRAPVIPSVILLREDEEVLTGEAAVRRATTEPQRVAREFKRRVGDPTPIIVGGAPYSADALTGKLLRWVVDKVAEREGGPPAGIAVSHPANWGDYKKDLLRQAINIADLDDVTTLSEPVAAAIHYASQERVEPGSVVAVYDLGGGTFDVAVLRKSDIGWEVLGEPQGIERLGGIDFDEAVFQHVVNSTDGVIDELDPDDPIARSAVLRLRQECVEAKEVLSTDTDVSIPVTLPNLQTEVRLTRSEFERMVRPALTDSITAMNRALRTSGVAAGDVSAVLLIGGSSRIPLVAQLVGSELGRPVAVDAHPKHGIALGAAIVAAQGGAEGPFVATAVDELDEDVAPGLAGLAALVDPGDVGSSTERPTTTPVVTAAAATIAMTADAPPTSPLTVAPRTPARGPNRTLIGVIVVAAVIAIGAIAAIALSGNEDDPTIDVATTEPVSGAVATASGDTTVPTVTEAPAPVASAVTAPEATTSQTATPAITEAPSTEPAPTTEPLPPGPFIRIDEVTLEGDRYRVHHTISGFEPDVGTSDALHLHFFLDTTEPANAGTNGDPPGDWDLTDETPTYLTKYGPASRGAALRLCAVVATFEHAVFDPESGNCADLPG